MKPPSFYVNLLMCNNLQLGDLNPGPMLQFKKSFRQKIAEKNGVFCSNYS
jgi:hypothetical protein